jgi:hypothetical protein
MEAAKAKNWAVELQGEKYLVGPLRRDSVHYSASIYIGQHKPETTQTNFHELNGIRNHSPSVRAVDGTIRLKPSGH